MTGKNLEFKASSKSEISNPDKPRLSFYLFFLDLTFNFFTPRQNARMVGFSNPLKDPTPCSNSIDSLSSPFFYHHNHSPLTAITMTQHSNASVPAADGVRRTPSTAVSDEEMGKSLFFSSFFRFDLERSDTFSSFLARLISVLSNVRLTPSAANALITAIGLVSTRGDAITELPASISHRTGNRYDGTWPPPLSTPSTSTPVAQPVAAPVVAPVVAPVIPVAAPVVAPVTPVAAPVVVAPVAQAPATSTSAAPALAAPVIYHGAPSTAAPNQPAYYHMPGNNAQGPFFAVSRGKAVGIFSGW